MVHKPVRLTHTNDFPLGELEYFVLSENFESRVIWILKIMQEGLG